MRLGPVALVVAVTLAALPTPAPAQVPSGPLTIHVEAVLGETTTVGPVRTRFPVNGTADLTSELVAGRFDVSGVGQVEVADMAWTWSMHRADEAFDESGFCFGTLDNAGNGTGRCASFGEFEGHGTWAGRIDVEGRSLVVDIYLQVVCPRCVPR